MGKRVLWQKCHKNMELMDDIDKCDFRNPPHEEQNFIKHLKSVSSKSLLIF